MKIVRIMMNENKIIGSFDINSCFKGGDSENY